MDYYCIQHPKDPEAEHRPACKNKYELLNNFSDGHKLSFSAHLIIALGESFAENESFNSTNSAVNLNDLTHLLQL